MMDKNNGGIWMPNEWKRVLTIDGVEVKYESITYSTDLEKLISRMDIITSKKETMRIEK